MIAPVVFWSPLIGPTLVWRAVIADSFTDALGTALPTGGAVALLLGLGGYLIREVNRGSRGAWKVVREKNREIHRLRWERDFWMARSLGDPPPSPYEPPSEGDLD